jgi:hypothetical protein
VEYLCLKGDRVFACDIDEHGLDCLRGTPGVTVMTMDVTRREDVGAAVEKMRGEGIQLQPRAPGPRGQDSPDEHGECAKRGACAHHDRENGLLHASPG